MRNALSHPATQYYNANAIGTHAQCTIAPCHTILKRTRNRHTSHTACSVYRIAYKPPHNPPPYNTPPYNALAPYTMLVPLIQCWTPLYNAGPPYTMLGPLIQCFCPLYNALAAYTWISDSTPADSSRHNDAPLQAAARLRTPFSPCTPLSPFMSRYATYRDRTCDLEVNSLTL